MTEVKEKKTADIKKEAEEIKCPVQRALYYVEEFLAGPMCGKCFPCEMGTFEAVVRLRKVTEGTGTVDDVAAIKRIADEMLESSRCKKGKDTAEFILEWMGSGSYDAHIAGKCPENECKAFIEYRVIPEKCTMCGLCKDVCKDNAVLGEKALPYMSGYLPFEIRQKRCTKCGECIKVCPVDAIEIIEIKTAEEVKA